MSKDYSNIISLTKNSRGIYSLDTTIGCKSGMEYQSGGCYGDCYAAKSAKIYGYNFNKTTLRNFKNKKHINEIKNKINNAKLDFIRIGCSGDPSENWNHTINIIKSIENVNKQIVIITRHWNILNDDHLIYFSKINICINTSISSLDDDFMRNKSIEQYERIKKYCKSVLRIVTCEFNLENEIGLKLNNIQNSLLKNELILDTVFRPNKNNYYVTQNIIKVKKGKFLDNNKTLMSKHNNNIFTGKCVNCHQMCGVTMKLTNKQFPNKKGIIKQLSIFKNKHNV